MGLGRLLQTRQAGGSEHNRVAGAGFQTIIDGTPISSAMGTYQGAMSVPGAWRAATLIADLLGSVPWNAYRQRGGQPVEQLDPTPPLLEQPSPPDPRVATFSALALDFLWHGNAIALIAARSYEGVPTAVLPVAADQVGVRRVEGGIEYAIGSKTYGPDDLIHIKGYHRPGALRGFGVLEAHMPTLLLAMEQQRQASSLSRHGVPTGTLKSQNPDLTQEEADALKARWLQAQRDRSIAVLNSTTEFQALSWNPEELQLVEARKFGLHEVALIFGLPLSFLGADQASRTYSNIEQEAINLLKFTLGGHLARFEQTLSLALPRGTSVKANLDSVLRADTLARYQAHKIGLDAGFLTVGEVRDLEDRPPLPTEGTSDDDPGSRGGEETNR